MKDFAALQVPEYYPGDLTAEMTPGLEDALGAMYGFGGQMSPINAALLGAGGNALGAVDQGLGWLYDQQEAGAPRFQFDQGTFDQTLANLMPGVQGTFDATMRDPYRQLTENVMPGIDLGASLRGTMYGTSPQNQTAIAQRGFNDRAADVYSGLYQNALNQAQGAGMAAGGANLSAEQALNDLLLRGYGNYGQLGAGMLGQGFTQGMQALQPGFSAGQYDLGYDQNAIDREITRYMFGQQAPQDFYANQLGMFGNLGSQFGKTSQSSSQGLGNIAAGLAGTYLMGGGSLPSLGSIFGGGAAAAPLGGFGGYMPSMPAGQFGTYGLNWGGGW